MEGRQISTANKLATTEGDISFTKEEIVAQSDIERIGSDVNMLVVEIDQQKYEEYLSPLSQVTWSKCDAIVTCTPIPDTRGSGNLVSTDKRGPLKTAAIELLFGQEILAEDGLFAAEESSGKLGNWIDQNSILK